MASFGNEGFNAGEHEPLKELEALPVGKYPAAIIESALTATKDGAGHFLQLTWQIIDGPHKNRKLFDRLNLHNKNPQAVEIAKAALSAICRAVGVMQPKDSVELHNLPLTISVKCEKDDAGMIRNVVKGYYKKGEAAATSPAPGATNGAVGDRPWKKAS